MLLSFDPQGLRKVMLVSILASLAVVLGILEAMIPFAVTIPGAKLGLGNIVVLTCLACFGGKDTAFLIVLKTLLTAFVLGSFSTLFFSLLGSFSSFLLMYLLLRFGGQSFSYIGISVAGGIAHNLGQLTAAAIVLGTTKIYYYLPFLLITGVATGVFVGLAARHLIASLQTLTILTPRKEG